MDRQIIQRILSGARALQEKVVAWRRDFHEHPELGFHEQRTAGIVADAIEKMGYRVRRKVGGMGVTGDLDVPGANGRILLRADMDALPLPDLTGDPFASKNPGLCHACGHDAHTAMLLGAAHLLMEMRKELKTSVRLMFQHAEEANPGGAIQMIEDGCLDGVDCAFALHVHTQWEAGQWAIRPGPVFAAVDRVTIRVRGRGVHAASAHLGVDPMVSMAQIVLAVQTIMSRRIRPQDAGVLSLCAVHGGEAFNVIPDEITLVGTIRSHNEEARAEIKRYLREICEGVAKANGASAEVIIDASYPPTVNDPGVTGVVRSTVADLFGSDRLVEMEKEFGGEDFSYVLQKVPGAFAFLGCGNRAKGITAPGHSSLFRIDEDVLWQGIAMHAAMALRRNRDRVV